jgi:hypothetical protein
MLVLGTLSQFEQCVLNMALINLCDSTSHVGEEMRRQYNAWKQLTDETVHNPWRDIHQFTIFLPHPDQTYEDITLEAGLTQGYNVEVEPVKNLADLVYDISLGGHFVVVLKQHTVNGEFAIAATGIFVRSLALLSLDVIVDMSKAEYQSIVVKHPIIRDYPQNWESQLRQFLQGELSDDALPQMVGYVDRSINRDYRRPSWNEVYLAGKDFIDL